MQDGDLFMGLAGTAGVFVGFAALIAVRSGGPTDPLEVAPMRMMASMAMLTIVAALAPVTLGRYDLTDHQVWALSSALVLIGFALIPAVSARTPEYRAAWSTSIAETTSSPSRRLSSTPCQLRSRQALPRTTAATANATAMAARLDRPGPSPVRVR